MLHQGRQASVNLFQSIAQRLAEKLPTKTRSYFLAFITGILFAIARRRTVTTWLQAAQISDDFQRAFYHMPNIGRKSIPLFENMLDILLEKLAPAIDTATYIRITLDDSPTKRYGKKVEGAGYHHNPTPGKTNATLCFGHSWVVAALVIAHPLFGEISFPIAFELYLRQKEIDKLKDKYDRKFQTKTAMAVAMIKRLVPRFARFEKKIEIIVDGGYAKDTVLLPLGKLSKVVTITRLRRDAALFSIPPKPTKPGRGRPRVYGDKIDLKSMVASNDDWQFVECRQYGKIVKKQVKEFVATSRLTRGKPIKVILVKEDEKTWVPLISTDAMMSAKEILESYAVRFGIEEMFKDLKEVWGWGKQEVRKLESNEAATAMNMLLYSITELATWERSQGELVDRSYRPWDDADRRPSHADRRNFLRRELLAKEFTAVLLVKNTQRKITALLEMLTKWAA
jgi:hypothetical protein